MVQGVGSGLGRAAIEAALKQMQERAARAKGDAVLPQQPSGISFGDKLKTSVEQVDSAVKATDELPVKVLRGEMDFHEVAAQLKESQLSFEFAMQVRNKLIDAYREVMRMNV